MQPPGSTQEKQREEVPAAHQSKRLRVPKTADTSEEPLGHPTIQKTARESRLWYLLSLPAAAPHLN